MKTLACLVLCLATLAFNPAFGQPGMVTPAIGQPALTLPAPLPGKPVTEEHKLTRFNLDFPGGTPRYLVAAVQKAMGKPLNAIIPDDYADIALPALKMNNVDVRELFDALQAASASRVAVVTGTYYGGGISGGPAQSYQFMTTSYGFKTQGNPTDDSIWYFYVEKPAQPPSSSPASPPKYCRFYSLTPYLDRGLTVDDITTAIQTGWKMLGDKDTPKISFHKETKLLIAVGEPSKLETIDAVLKALEPPKAGTAAPAAASKATEKPKAEQ